MTKSNRKAVLTVYNYDLGDFIEYYYDYQNKYFTPQDNSNSIIKKLTNTVRHDIKVEAEKLVNSNPFQLMSLEVKQRVFTPYQTLREDSLERLV